MPLLLRGLLLQEGPLQLRWCISNLSGKNVREQRGHGTNCCRWLSQAESPSSMRLATSSSKIIKYVNVNHKLSIVKNMKIELLEIEKSSFSSRFPSLQV